ncbi:MAG: PP2C family protein-serine/threonine phosphatase [Myxococcaceae bacterium]
MESPGQPADLEHILQILRRALYRDPDAPFAPGEIEERVFVRGQDEAGLLLVSIQSGDAFYQLKVPDVQSLVSLVGPPQRPARADDALVLPYVPKTAPQLTITEHPVDRAGKPVALIHGGEAAQTMEGIVAVRGIASRAAGFTSRGPTTAAQRVEYKPFNEDAMALWMSAGDASANRREICGVGAFDMAGGEGSVEGSAGAASDMASRAFGDALAAIHAGGEPQETLRDGVHKASDAVRGLGVGAVSTFTAAVLITEFKEGVVSSRCVYVATVGDSRALLIDKKGTLKNKSRLHNLGANIAAGEVPDAAPATAHQFASALSRGLGTENDIPDLYVWPTEPGDRVLVETDGIGDAREFEQMPVGTWHADKCAEDQSKILAHVQNAPDVVKTVVSYALDQMAERYGKPDNVGLAVLEVLDVTR